MSKIEKLTPEQESRFDEFKQKWLAIGLSTQACDRAKAQQSVIDAYKIVGLEPPDRFVWFDSPLSMCIGDALLRDQEFTDKLKITVSRDSVGASVGDSVGDSVGASVWDSVRDSVRDSVWASVRDSVWASVRASVGDSVRASVWASVRDSVGASVWASVGDSVRASVRDSVGASVGTSVWASVGASVWASVYGSHDAAWLAFYNYFLEVCGLEVCKKLQPLIQLAEQCGWWIPRTNIVMLSGKPIYCNLNLRGVIHADGRMAVEYRDGFGVYANDGVRLPEKYGNIKTKNWESSWLLTETNAELRMCLIKNIGYDKICQELEAKKLDSWREYELLKIENVDVESICLLKMTCPSTGKIHALRVPPNTKKAREAITLCNRGIDPETFIIEH